MVRGSSTRSHPDKTSKPLLKGERILTELVDWLPASQWATPKAVQPTQLPSLHRQSFLVAPSLLPDISRNHGCRGGNRGTRVRFHALHDRA